MSRTIDDLEKMFSGSGLPCMRVADFLVTPIILPKAPDKYVMAGFRVGDDFIVALSQTDSFSVDEENRPYALSFCNNWNTLRPTPRASVGQDGQLHVDMTIRFKGLSREYVINNVIRRFVREAGEFYAEALEKL